MPIPSIQDALARLYGLKEELENNQILKDKYHTEIQEAIDMPLNDVADVCVYILNAATLSLTVRAELLHATCNNIINLKQSYGSTQES